MKKAFFFIFILFGIPPAAPQPWFYEVSRSKICLDFRLSLKLADMSAGVAKGLKKNKQPLPVRGGRALADKKR